MFSSISSHFPRFRGDPRFRSPHKPTDSSDFSAHNLFRTRRIERRPTMTPVPERVLNRVHGSAAGPPRQLLKCEDQRPQTCWEKHYSPQIVAPSPEPPPYDQRNEAGEIHGFPFRHREHPPNSITSESLSIGPAPAVRPVAGSSWASRVGSRQDVPLRGR